MRKGVILNRKRHLRSAPLLVEPLEARICLAADTFLVNFQLDGALTPTRYLADKGDVFGVRTSGFEYGWSSDHTDVSRDRGLEPDQRLDTLVHFHEFQNWEFQLDNGDYEVTVSIGDAEFDSTHTLNVEGTNIWNAVPLNPGEYLESTLVVTVADGRMTLDQGNAFEKATRINFIKMVQLPAGPNGNPLVPVVTEPVLGSLDVNPTDVHMEAGGYSDPENDEHYSSDWRIKDVGGNVVWETLGIRGGDRRHTHLADGVFINSHAGRTELFGETDYVMEVRFRDEAGSTSDFATRAFRTGAASTIYPLEIQDIVTSPAPDWELVVGGDVVLPAFNLFPSNMSIDTSEGNLLQVTAFDGQTNNVTNPAALNDHNPIRITLVAGDEGLNLGESNLVFFDESLIRHTIYFPAIDLAAGSPLVLWVDAAGATYFGQPGSDVPDFTNLARESDAEVPFVATRPGYVVEEVAGGFQLPVNVAFVPNPTTNPSDPLFYVAELYGTVKVVTNSGAVSDFATGLLNFDPTGNFPGSGEQGLAGIVVDPATGDLIVSRVTSDIPFDDSSPHHPQVVRLVTQDGGLTSSSEVVLLDMPGESQGQSHQISNVSIGPDGLVYVHNGDGFNASTGQNVNSFRGKVLRMNLDGSAPTDNPFYDASNGITSTDYIFAYGFRNPFGGAWRESDGQHYQVENGPSVDRLTKVERGVNYGWDGSDASMFTEAIYNWVPAHAPVNIAFTQPSTFAGSQFPPEMMDIAFVSESGPTYANGPQVRGKRIVTFEMDAQGELISGPDSFVEYVGTGRATVVGLTAGPDGLYFTDLYRDLDAATPIDSGARVLRVRYVNPVDGDFNDDGIYDCLDVDALVAEVVSGSSNVAFDLNGDGNLDINDVTAWLAEAGEANLGPGRAYLGGDADLDGTVDGQDFLVWNNNKFSSGNHWCGADFNADGTTDGADFLVWNSNKFQSAVVAVGQTARPSQRELADNDRESNRLIPTDTLEPNRPAARESGYTTLRALAPATVNFEPTNQHSENDDSTDQVSAAEFINKLTFGSLE